MTVILIIIKLPPFNSILLSFSREEVLYVIELIKQNACAISSLKDYLQINALFDLVVKKEE